MRFYEIKFNLNEFQHLDVDTRRCKTDDELLMESMRIEFHGEERKNWDPPTVYSPNPKLPEPDIWYPGTGAGAFALTPDTLEKFGEILKLAGQLMTLPYKNRTLTICNILVKIDCVRENTTTWRIDEEHQRVMTLKPVFTPNCIPSSSLFKLPLNQFRHTILCWERNGDPKTEFRACVLANKMKGIRFDLVWEGEEPQ